jgi:hypothetical protein
MTADLPASVAAAYFLTPGSTETSSGCVHSCRSTSSSWVLSGRHTASTNARGPARNVCDDRAHSLWQGLNEHASELFLKRQANTVTLEEVERTLAAYLEAFERILSLPTGSLPRNQATIREWFGP